jgi:uncharacterized membrane protein
MNPAHLHLLVNHLPIVGFAIGVLLLIATMIFRGDRGMFLASLIVIVMSGAGGLAAQFTGEPAEEVVEGLPDVPDSLVGTHEDAAKFATIIASITTVLGVVIAFVVFRRDGDIPWIATTILLVATVATSAAMAWTGSTGGKIRHTEIRDGAVTPHSD